MGRGTLLFLFLITLTTAQQLILETTVPLSGSLASYVLAPPFFAYIDLVNQGSCTFNIYFTNGTKVNSVIVFPPQPGPPGTILRNTNPCVASAVGYNPSMKMINALSTGSDGSFDWRFFHTDKLQFDAVGSTKRNQYFNSAANNKDNANGGMAGYTQIIPYLVSGSGNGYGNLVFTPGRMWSVLPIGDTNYYSSTTTAGSSTQQPISFNTVGNFVYFLLPSNNNNGGTVIYNATWNYIYKVNHNAFFINNTIPSSVNQLLPQNASDGSIDFAYTISSVGYGQYYGTVKTPKPFFLLSPGYSPAVASATDMTNQVRYWVTNTNSACGGSQCIFRHNLGGQPRLIATGIDSSWNVQQAGFDNTNLTLVTMRLNSAGIITLDTFSVYNCSQYSGCYSCLGINGIDDGDDNYCSFDMNSLTCMSNQNPPSRASLISNVALCPALISVTPTSGVVGSNTTVNITTNYVNRTTGVSCAFQSSAGVVTSTPAFVTPSTGVSTGYVICQSPNTTNPTAYTLNITIGTNPTLLYATAQYNLNFTLQDCGGPSYALSMNCIGVSATSSCGWCNSVGVCSTLRNCAGAWTTNDVIVTSAVTQTISFNTTNTITFSGSNFYAGSSYSIVAQSGSKRSNVFPPTSNVPPSATAVSASQITGTYTPLTTGPLYFALYRNGYLVTMPNPIQISSIDCSQLVGCFSCGAYSACSYCSGQCVPTSTATNCVTTSCSTTEITNTGGNNGGSLINGPTDNLNKTPIIIGCVIGGLLVVLIVVFIILIILRKRNRDRSESMIAMERQMPSAPNFSQVAYVKMAPLFPLTDNEKRCLNNLEKALLDDQGVPMMLSKMVDREEAETYSRCYMYIALYRNHRTAMELLLGHTADAINSAGVPAELFRENNVSTHMFVWFARSLGMPYLYNSLAKLVWEISLPQDGSVVDPRSISNNESDFVDVNVYQLLMLLSKAFNNIRKSVGEMSPWMRRAAAEITLQTSGKFPGMDNRALGSLYFQRYIVAAITSPQEWYLLQEENSSQVQRVLTVIGGVMQNLAFNTMPSVRAPHLAKFDQFVSDNIPRLKKFYDVMMNMTDNLPDTSTGVPEECRQESLIWMHNFLYREERRLKGPSGERLRNCLSETPISKTY